MSEEQKTSFEALYEITKSINSILEPVALLEKILETTMAHLNAERGSVLLVDGAKERGFSVVAAKNFGLRTFDRSVCRFVICYSASVVGR